MPPEGPRSYSKARAGTHCAISRDAYFAYNCDRNHIVSA